MLYHRGDLERPRAQIDYYHRGGPRAIAYGLGNQGAALLNRDTGRIFLKHALLIP